MPIPHPLARPRARQSMRPLVRRMLGRMVRPLAIAAERLCESWEHQRRQETEEYLAAATDLCDLERRLREVERRS